MKAKFIRAYYPKYEKCKALTYQYRGYEYTIFDYGMNGMTLCEQHKMEQNRIDSIIEIEEKATTKESAEETAAEAFAYFWELVN